MSSALDDVLTAAVSHQTDSETAYAELIATLADNEAVDPEESMSVVSAAGRSMADLQRDVELRVRRINAAAVLATLPTVKAEQRKLAANVEQVTHAAGAELRATLARLDAERAAAIAKRDAAVNVAQVALDGADARVTACHECERRLRETASPELRERAAELRSTRDGAVSTISKLREQVRKEERILANLTTAYGVNYQGTVMAKNRIAELREEIDRRELRFPELETDLAAAAAELLVP